MSAPPPRRLIDAAALILDELAAQRGAEADLARRRTAARDRAYRLLRSLDAVLSTLPPAERRPFVQRRDAIEGRAGPPAGALGATPVTSAILAYLAAHEAETVTVAEINEHLAAAGLPTVRAHAAITLGRFTRHGLVARVRRGIYRVNRFHPELAGLRQGPADAAGPTRNVVPEA